MDNESPEVIEQQMEETRQSLTDKVSALETQVVGTVQTATQAVQDTVETVRAAVQDTVTSVKDSVQDSVTAVTDNVKETLDVTRHVEEHPYLMLGGAVVAGLITGLLVFRKDESRPMTIADAPLAYPPDFNGTPVRERESERPGILDEVLSMAGSEGKQLAREAVNQAAQAVRQHVMPALVNWMTQNIEQMFERPATPATWETPERTYAHR